VTAAPEQPRARVVILGWHDATPRHLRAVARLHEARGDVVLPMLSDAGRSLSRPGGFEARGRAQAHTIARAHAERALPLVFHSFSNAGFWTLSSILDALARDHRVVLDAHRGTILDSAPGFPERISASFTARTAPMAFLPALLGRLGRPRAHQHRILSPVLGALFGLWHLSAPRQIAFMQSAPARVRAVHRPHGSRPARPILAIWGGADVLVPREHVEAFLIGAEGEQIPVTRLYFPSSAHVRHLVAHRAAYEIAVRELMSSALR